MFFGFPGQFPKATGTVGYGTYVTRPSAVDAGINAFYLATDIGVNGCLLRSDGAVWKQFGVCRLFDLTANTAFTTTTEASIFGTGTGSTALPNGCLAIGTHFVWGAFATVTAAGPGGAQKRLKSYIGSTAVADSGIENANFNWTPDNSFILQGAMTVRTLGTSGTVMGSGIMTETNDTFGGTAAAGNLYYKGMQSLGADSRTPKTVDTTGAISPDVKLTLPSITNSSNAYIQDAWMDVTGLVG